MLFVRTSVPVHADIPDWLIRVLTSLTRGWYDPARAERSQVRTDQATARSEASVLRAQSTIEAYRVEGDHVGRRKS